MKVVAVLVLAFPLILTAQENYVFGTNVKVNDDPGGQAYHTVYSSGAHTIAARGDTVYIAYRGDQAGADIYFSKSTDGGQTWTPGLRVNYPGAGFLQALTVDQHGTIFIVYNHYDTTGRDVHFTKSTDGGVSFSYPIRINDVTTYTQWFPTIAVDTSGQQVFVAWTDCRNYATSSYDIYFSRSTDGGVTFEPNVRIDDTDNDPSWQRHPSIAVDRGGNNVYVTWYDERNSSTDDIYFARSTDGGISFLPNVLVNDTVTTGFSTQWQPTIAIDTLGRIFIAWNDERNGNEGCFLARSDDGGFSFGDNIKVSEGVRLITQPSIAVDDLGGVYLAWRDRRLVWGGDRIYFAYSNTMDDSFHVNVRVDDLPEDTEYWLWNPTLTINEEKKVFIAWQDDRYNHMNYTDIFFASGTYVGIEEYYDAKPSFMSFRCYPSPFTNTTVIRYEIRDAGYVIQDFSLKIYDITGNLVKSFSSVPYAPSAMHISWDGTDRTGREVPCGAYFIELTSGGKRQIKKVVKIE